SSPSAGPGRSARPALPDEHHAKAVWILERHAVLGPVRVRRGHRGCAEPPRDGPYGLLVTEVEHEQGLRVGRRSAVIAAGGELEVQAGAGHGEEDAGVAVMALEAAD